MAGKISAMGNDLFGIIRRPGPTLGPLMGRKRWLVSFLFILLTVGIVTFFVAPMQIKGLFENLKNSGAFPNDQLLFMQVDPSSLRLMTSLTAMLSIALALAADAFFVYLFFGIGGVEGDYAHFFSLVANASIIDTVFPTLLRSLSYYVNLPLLGILSAPTLLPIFSPHSIGHFMLLQVNVFSVWYMMALALGVNAFSKIGFKRSLIISVCYFVFKVLLHGTYTYLFLQITRA